jgi:signal transduction histidine kinase
MGPLNPDQDSTLKTIRRSTERLEHLIEDLINFSQMSEGDVAIRLINLDVSRMITNVLKHSTAKAEEKKIDFKIKQPDEPIFIRADEEKITWVMNQLMDNAIKFTPENGHVNLIVEKYEMGIQFCVEDSGIGIPAEKLEDIFQPFHQLDGSSTRRYGGTGLGLSLVRQIVEAHHSHITVVSEPGRYTRFSFGLPSIPPGKTDHV